MIDTHRTAWNKHLMIFIVDSRTILIFTMRKFVIQRIRVRLVRQQSRDEVSLLNRTAYLIDWSSFLTNFWLPRPVSTVFCNLMIDYRHLLFFLTTLFKLNPQKIIATVSLSVYPKVHPLHLLLMRQFRLWNH